VYIVTIAAYILLYLFCSSIDGYPYKTELKCDKNFSCTYKAEYLIPVKTEKINFQLGSIKSLKKKSRQGRKELPDLTFKSKLYLKEQQEPLPLLSQKLYYGTADFILYQRILNYVKYRKSGKKDILPYLKDLKDSDFFNKQSALKAVQEFPDSMKKYNDGFLASGYIIDKKEFIFCLFAAALLLFLIPAALGRWFYLYASVLIYILPLIKILTVDADKSLPKILYQLRISTIVSVMILAVYIIVSIKHAVDEKKDIGYYDNKLLDFDDKKTAQLFENLLKLGYADNFQLDEAEKEAEKTLMPAGSVLLKNNIITNEQLKEALTFQKDYDAASAEDLNVSDEVLLMLPQNFIIKNKVFPLSYDEKGFTIGMVNPDDKKISKDIKFLTGLKPNIKLITYEEFLELTKRLKKNSC